MDEIYSSWRKIILNERKEIDTEIRMHCNEIRRLEKEKELWKIKKRLIEDRKETIWGMEKMEKAIRSKL